MSKPIISVSGLRGIVGDSLTLPLVIDYVAAFLGGLSPGHIVVTRDGRTSGAMLADAISAVINACGRDVLDGGIAATPTTGVLVREHKAAGGVQISASHNPPQYNGIKLFGSDGRVISANAGQAVIDRMGKSVPWANVEGLGRRQHVDDPHAAHLALVLDTVDVAAIRARRFRAVLDSNHGAGSLLGKRLLDALGCEVHLLGGEADGQFAHPPEPTRNNLQPVCKAAPAFKADVMFCQDPDADRLAIVDSSGEYIGEEYTLALTLKNRLARDTGDCVINCATSRMSIDVAEQFGCRCHLSAVGEANVSDRMMAVDAVYGGEGNGGPIDPRVGYVRDSFVGMAQVLELMATSGESIAQLVRSLPSYAIFKTQTTIDVGGMTQIYQRLEAAFADAVPGTLDGLRLDWPDRWLLVRPSNTEPIVRIICEAADDGTARQLAEQALAVVTK